LKGQEMPSNWEGDMKKFENIFTKRVNQKNIIESKKLKAKAKRNPKSFIKDFLRKEGLALNERLRSKIEKLVDTTY
jgi:hypothetical protein